MIRTRHLLGPAALTALLAAVSGCSSSGTTTNSTPPAASAPQAGAADATSGAASGGSSGGATSAAPAAHVDLCASFTPADMSAAVGDTFVSCKQDFTTDPVTRQPVVTATYSESDDLRILVVQHAAGARTAFETYHPDTKITGIGDEAWYGELAFDLKAAYGDAVMSAQVGLKTMGSGDPLAVDKKVLNAVAAKLGLQP